MIPAIIPARGGSKGVPRKNIRELAGKPLLAHSIEQAQSASEVSEVFVSTDDTEIASVARSHGASVISRPADISGDSASSESALLHALSHIRETHSDIELVVFLQCTSPVRAPGDIDGAVHKLRDENADSLLSVAPSHRFLWTYEDGEVRSTNFDYNNRPRRQDMAPQYVENGSIYVFKTWVLEQRKNRLGGDVALYVMGEGSAFEIDSPFDFGLVEYIMHEKGLNS